jgi:endothelin-converting enzyme/putative endopeptidase
MTVIRRIAYSALAICYISIFSLAADNAAPTKGIEFDSLDKSVDPCVDFYQFACGGWRTANPLTADKPAWNRYSAMAEKNREVLKTILDQASTAKNQSAWMQQIGDDYAACMDESAVDRLGAKPLQPLFARIDSIKDKRDLARAVAYFHRINIPMLFDFGSMPSLRDAKQVIAQVDQGGIGLPEREYYFRQDAKSIETRKKYVEHVARMMQLIGSSEDDAQKQAEMVMKLEAALAEASLNRVQRRDPKALDHTMTVKEFEALAPTSEFTTYFKETAAPSFASLNVGVPDFFARLNKELDAAIGTDRSMMLL